MTAKTTKKRNKRFKRGEKRCFTPRYLTYKDSPKREIQEPQVLGRGHRGQRPQSSPSGEEKNFVPGRNIAMLTLLYKDSQRGKSKNLRFLAGGIRDSVPNCPRQARKKLCPGRNIAMLALLYKDSQRGKSKNLRFLAGVIGDSVPYRPRPAREKLCSRQKYSHAYPAFIRTPQRGKSKNLRFLAGVIRDSVPYRPPLHPSAESERKPA